VKLQPYVYFDGRCEEAIEFYRKAIGAELVMLLRFKEAPEQSMISPSNAEKVMHATLRIGETTVLVSDGRCGPAAMRKRRKFSRRYRMAVR
jgi:PhnB protein